MENSINQLNDNNNIELAKPTILIKQSWELYIEKFWLFIKVILYTLLGIIPVIITLIIGIVVDTFKLSGTLSNILVFISIFIALIFAMYYSIRSKAGMFLVCSLPTSTSAKEIFASTKEIFWPFVVVNFLTGTMVLLWSFLFIIPGVIFGIYYSFSTLLVVYEKKQPWESIKESKNLVKNHWWPVFGRFVLLGIIITLFSLPFIIIDQLLPEKSFLSVFWNLITSIALTIISPFYILYTYFIYKNLKQIKSI